MMNIYFRSLMRMFLLAAIVSLFSCKNNVAYEKYETLGSNYEWRKSKPVTFIIPITDNSKPYEFDLAFRCATGFAYDKLIVQIEETAPSGKVTRKDMEVPVRNEDGTFQGEMGFDLVDIVIPIAESKEYPTHGDYRYEIQHVMQGVDTLDYALEIGLILRAKE